MVGNSNRDSEFSSEKFTDALQTESTVGSYRCSRSPSRSSEGAVRFTASTHWQAGELGELGQESVVVGDRCRSGGGDLGPRWLSWWSPWHSQV